MNTGDKLEIIQHYGGLITINFVSSDGKTRKPFMVGDAAEALKYLLLDDVGRERIDVQIK